MILVLLTAGGVFLVVLYNLLFKRNTPSDDDKKNVLPMSELPLSETYPPVRSEPPPLPPVLAPEIKVNVETTAAAAPVEEVVAAPTEAAVVFATPAQAVLPPQEETWVIEADELSARSAGTEVLKVADLSTPSIASCSASLSEIDNTLKRLESRITSVVQDSNELTADEESYLLQNTQDLLSGEVAASAAPVSSENESAAAGKGDEEAANILHDVKPAAEETTVEISQPTPVTLADIEQQIIALGEKEATIEAEIADAVETVVPAEPEQKSSVEAEITPAVVQTGIFQATPVAVSEEPITETQVSAPLEVAPVKAAAPEPELAAAIAPETNTVVAEISAPAEVTVPAVEITAAEPVTPEAEAAAPEPVTPQSEETPVETAKINESAEMPIVESPIHESVVVPVTETPVVEPTPTIPVSEIPAPESVTDHEVQAQEPIPAAEISSSEALVAAVEIPIAEPVVESPASESAPEVSVESVKIAVEEPKSIDVPESAQISVEPFPAAEEVPIVSNVSDTSISGDVAAVSVESAPETKAADVESSNVPETHQLVSDIAAELTDAVETLVLADEPQKPTVEISNETVEENVKPTEAVETTVEPVQPIVEVPPESAVHEVAASELESKLEAAPIQNITEPVQPDAVSSDVPEIKSEELSVEAPIKSPDTPDNSPEVSVSIDTQSSSVNVSNVAEIVDSVINEAVDILEKRLTEQVESVPEPSKAAEPLLVDISDYSPVTQTEIKEEKATESLVELVIESPNESAGNVPDSSADKAEIKLETLAAAEPLILDEPAKTEEKTEESPKPAEVATSLLVDLSEPKVAAEVDLESFVVVPKEKKVTADIDNVYTLIAECQSGATEQAAGSAPASAPINSPATPVSNPPTTNEAANTPSANE